MDGEGACFKSIGRTFSFLNGVPLHAASGKFDAWARLRHGDVLRLGGNRDGRPGGGLCEHVFRVDAPALGARGGVAVVAAASAATPTAAKPATEVVPEEGDPYLGKVDPLGTEVLQYTPATSGEKRGERRVRGGAGRGAAGVRWAVLGGLLFALGEGRTENGTRGCGRWCHGRRGGATGIDGGWGGVSWGEGGWVGEGGGRQGRVRGGVSSQGSGGEGMEGVLMNALGISAEQKERGTMRRGTEGGGGRGGERRGEGTVEGQGGKTKAAVRRAYSEVFRVFAANVGGLHLGGRTEGAASGGGIGGALARGFVGGSKWDRLQDKTKRQNVDEQRTKIYALLVLTETQTKSGEVTETRRMLLEMGYKSVITRGVRGRGRQRAREERGGVIVAWDPKSLVGVGIGGKKRGHSVVVQGRVVHVRFRVAGGDATTWAPESGGIQGGSGSEGRGEGSGGGSGAGWDLDLVACYMPQRRGSVEATREATTAWEKLGSKVAKLAVWNKLLVMGDMNAELLKHLEGRGVRPTEADHRLDTMHELMSVERLGGDGREEWTSAVHYNADKEVKTVIDHAYGGTLWNARVESTSVVDGIELCTYNGHCHRALELVVRRAGHAPLEGAEWREQAGALCEVKDGVTDGECLKKYRTEVKGQYKRLLREARRL